MGNLYIVSTPIGNLGDISHRALEILKKADLILSEDTRETDKILQKWNILTPQISYREENHKKIIQRILDDLAADKDLALVSDSGTPVISDPGFQLVREIHTQNIKKPETEIEVISIPGPSAVISALSVSGLPTDNFTFLGFLPKKNSQKEKLLKEFGSLPTTLVIYESPYRIKKLLTIIYETLGDRTICLAKDLTKKFEDVKTAPVKTLLKNPQKIIEKGEYVVLISKQNYTLN